jgi:hypothetical protein
MTDLVVPTDNWVDVRTTEVGWQPEGDMPFDQWVEVGRQLLRAGRAWQFWLGDWILYGEKHHGEMYDDAVDITGYDRTTLRNIVVVCRAVEMSRRRDDLTFTHHVEVAPLPPAEQDAWLTRAAEEKWPASKLRAARAEARSLAPVVEEQASTFVAEISFVYAADDETAAREKLEDVVKRMERQGLSVTFKRVQERHA